MLSRKEFNLGSVIFSPSKMKIIVLPCSAAEKFYLDSEAHKRCGSLHCWNRFSVQIGYLCKTEMHHIPWLPFNGTPVLYRTFWYFLYFSKWFLKQLFFVNYYLNCINKTRITYDVWKNDPGGLGNHNRNKPTKFLSNIPTCKLVPNTFHFQILSDSLQIQVQTYD